MKIYDKDFTPVQTMLTRWVMRRVNEEFTLGEAEKAYSSSKRNNSIIIEICAGTQRLEDFCEILNRVPVIHAKVWYEWGSSAGIHVKLTNFWQEGFREETLGFIRRRACSNGVPFDVSLNDYLDDRKITLSNAGFCIEGQYGYHDIYFTVNEYSESVWDYSGVWDGHYISGLASSTSLAIGKMLAAIYKGSMLHDQEVAQALKAGFFRFHVHKYLRI